MGKPQTAPLGKTEILSRQASSPGSPKAPLLLIRMRRLFRLFPFVYMINILASPPPSPPSGSGTQGGWGWKPKGVEGWRKGVGHSRTGSVAGPGLCGHDSLCVPRVARSISWGRRAGLLEVGLVKCSSGPEGGTFGAKHLCPPVASAGTLPVRGRGVISHRKPPFLELIGGPGLGL